MKISLEVHDVIMCLDGNLKRHIVGYIVKQLRFDIEIWPIDRIILKEVFY